MADIKISALPAASGVTADDLVPIVNDPGGTPATQKATAAQLLTYLLSAPIPIASGGTGASTAAAARAALNVESRTTFNNANYIALATDKYIAQIGTLSAPRTITLPAANAVNPGFILWIADESGTVTNTNTISIARTGADTINGGTASFAMIQPRSRVRAISDGVSAWFINDSQFGVKEYTATETDALPNATFVQWELWGSGGGGGSGARGATTALRGGGGGGGGGGFVKTAVFLISDLGGPGTSVVNTIGAGGSIGAAATIDGSGNPGGNGGLTSVAITNKINPFVGGGSGGGAGTTSGGAAGAIAVNTMFPPGAGGAGGVGAAGSNGTGAGAAGGGGGGGGGLDAADTNRAGGTGSRGATLLGEGSTAAAAGGLAGGGNGTATLSANALAPLPTSAGPGGGSNNAGVGGNGGAGGRGMGGGGGGASQGANSGAGGLGGSGYIRRMTW